MFAIPPRALRHLSPARREFASLLYAFILAADRNASHHLLRSHHNNASHPICLEKLAQFLFDNKAPATRRVTQEDSFAIAHDDSDMKHIKILAYGHKKNQITALQM